MSRGTADLRAQVATQVDVSLTERLIALILLVGLALSLFHVWDYYDTGFASDYALSHSFVLWRVGGLIGPFLVGLQYGALLAVGALLGVSRPGHTLVDEARRRERS